MTEIKTLKTLTLKEIGHAIPKGGGEFLNKTIALVSGVAEGYFMKANNFGESICLTGSFVIVNTMTGEVFDGSHLYMPADYASAVAKKLDKSENGSVVELANVEVVVSASEKAARGYTFITRALNTIETVNKKKALAAAMLSSLKALPAPETKQKKTA